ncbi:65-kDa microtubule-associated protein 4 [Herrania umbratica]|uniref:65-kDa microtubule-associated protein 4 n=1 Tax=Herrania umbratica TaxID=108875 RepID=A0A6J0ZZ65_9ROSI|nr:65-kDa microtubule-associated protein 4 [Herrania umbratica]XP_021280137.1 65-kDa microtubule-associated protein 4 [Herrania umbratica]
MLNHKSEQFARIETTCGSLLCELQKIWDEVGEADGERDAMLLDLEQECLKVYMRKVDEAKECRTKLQRDIAIAKAEISDICASIGENPVHRDLKPGGNLKEELEAIGPLLEDMRRKNVERINQFIGVIDQIQKISNEILGFKEQDGNKLLVDDTNLSLRRLEELHRELHELQNEKINRLNQVQGHLNTINSLCTVLGMDFLQTVCRIHATLDDSNGAKDVSNNTIARLAAQIQSLQELKIKRMQKIQDLASALLELWHLMDTPAEEQRMFLNVTSKIAASEPEITEANMLSIDCIKNVEEEVSRLEQLKTSKMKEIVLKKKVELEDMCRRTHMVLEALISTDYSIEAMESGAIDPLYLLEQIDLQISKVREEAFSRKEILEKVEKWLVACEEESWLEEYNRDDNRYNAGRGAHLSLKRAEKARVVVNKIPAMVEVLTLKTTAWEKERGNEFLYDGRRLLSVLEDYSNLRQEKDLERQRQRDQKKLHGQLIAEQEALYGSKPSPSISGTKAPRMSTVGASDRKLSLGGAMLQQVKPEKPATRLHPNKKADYLNQNSFLNHQRSSGFAAHSVKRNSEVPGRVIKKQPLSAAKVRENESPAVRKPLSPVSFAVNSNANIVNFTEDQKKVKNGQRLNPGCQTPTGVPAKPTLIGDDENRTPKAMPIPMPTTPSTVSAPMLMAMTPATPATLGAYKVENVLERVQQVEYSFEELRAGFVLS